MHDTKFIKTQNIDDGKNQNLGILITQRYTTSIMTSDKLFDSYIFLMEIEIT